MMDQKNKFLLFPPVLALLALLLSGVATAEEKTHTGFNLEERVRKRGNILDIIFGTPPPMPTERGKVIIHAFHDRNGNGERDPGEERLRKGLSCTVDGMTYSLPAFVPGLRLDRRFEVACSGGAFEPQLSEKNVFFERRGEIVRLEVPCVARGTPEEATDPAQPGKPG